MVPPSLRTDGALFAPESILRPSRPSYLFEMRRGSLLAVSMGEAELIVTVSMLTRAWALVTTSPSLVGERLLFEVRDARRGRARSAVLRVTQPIKPHR